ncbi:Plasminogen-like protein [Dinothrombium tinctorium]|uniref:Plasminogen-like protein n=2 Tax=Dinothrombium tinctorium TaxID=1965070 RepID=A0A3S3SMB1_9ACAR|nr:Plasminogen-like protein [Dinothrombium tinctorium]
MYYVSRATSKKHRCNSVCDSGYLTSPNYGENRVYTSNTLCSWTIEAPKNKLIELNFLNFDVEYSFRCRLDGLYIFDGKTRKDRLLQMLCGQNIPDRLVSTSNALHLVFITNALRNAKGFLLKYSIHEVQDSENCASDEFRCRNHLCISKKQICDFKDDCGDGTDEEKCKSQKMGDFECGKPAFEFEESKKVINQKKIAKPGIWPWMVSVRYIPEEPYGHRCGGVLIHPQWILTAAHCFRRGFNISEWSLLFGKYREISNDETQVRRYINRIIIHPDYLPLKDDKKFANRKDNDIALIELNAPLVFNDYIRAICLPHTYYIERTGITAYVTGWGYAEGKLQFEEDERLKEASVTLLNRLYCQKLYKRKLVVIPKLMLCAGHLEGGADACKGDSGGPLVVKFEGVWYVIGIVSSGEDCGLPNQPGIYTKVTSYRSWIRKYVHFGGTTQTFF